MASLWEVWVLVALVAGRWRAGVLVLLGFLLLDGLYTALALWQAGLVSYVSGSHHYLLGALALGALPLFLAQAGRGGPYPLAAFLLAVLALYAALISGARAVYLPLLVLLPLAFLRLSREGLGPWRALILFLGLGGGVALLEALVPGNAILNALSFKAAITQQEVQSPGVGQGGGGVEAPQIGNVEARLLMWRLSLRLALDHPLGTGNGSYNQVFGHATLRAGMTTEERLYKLEGIVEGVMATLPSRVAGVENRMDLLRQELKGELQALRQEVKEEIQALRQEVREEIQALRLEVSGEIQALRQELKGDVHALRQEVMGEIQALRQEVKGDINAALNRLMLYFTALAAALALLTLLR